MAERNRRDAGAPDEYGDDAFDDAVDEEVQESRGGGTATKKRPSRSGGGAGFGRIGRFIREVVAELRKVIWPTRKELVTYTVVVVVFIAFMLAVIALLDVVFARGVLWVFGNPE